MTSSSLPHIAALALIWSIGGFIAAIRFNGRYSALLYGPLYWVFMALWYWADKDRSE